MRQAGRLLGAALAMGALVIAGAVDARAGTAPPGPTPPATSPQLPFDVTVNGFSFPNYGNDDGVTNLTSADVVALFGDSACAMGSGEGCTLSPPAARWMQESNARVNGGHCEGMAALALMMDEGLIDPNQFGAPTAGQLTLAGNVPLQREIAKWWVTQSLDPTYPSTLTGPPAGIVNALRQWFANPSGSSGYTIGFYKRNGTDGHAVTAIGLRDRGPDAVDIAVYDNNYPGETRYLAVDTANNTWSYNGSPNPDQTEGLYEGDDSTRTLFITPTAARLQPQRCPFCDAAAQASGLRAVTTTPPSDSFGLAPAAPAASGPRLAVYLDAAAFDAGARVEVLDANGQPLAGVTRDAPRGGDELNTNDEPPVFFVPTDAPFDLVIDATAATAEVADAGLTIVGAGVDAGVEGISLQPGQRDTLTFDPATTDLRYTTTSTESPTVFVGFDGHPDSFDFSFAGVELGASGGSLDVRLDRSKRVVAARTSGSADAAVALSLERINDAGDEVLTHDNLPLAPNETFLLDYGSWTGNGSSVKAGIDQNGDGVIDEPLEITDQA